MCIWDLFLGAPGIIQFEKSFYYVNKSQRNLSVSLIRQHGSTEEVSVNIHYIDMTVKYGITYTGEVQMKFGHGETQNVLEIQILELEGKEGDMLFGIKLYNPEGGARIENVNQTVIGEP